MVLLQSSTFPPGSRGCYFLEMLRFLRMVKKKQPVTVYGIYHQRLWKTDIKKAYRYLRYAVSLKLIVLNHKDNSKGGLPAKYYRLTGAGEGVVEWAASHGIFGA